MQRGNLVEGTVEEWSVVNIKLILLIAKTTRYLSVCADSNSDHEVFKGDHEVFKADNEVFRGDHEVFEGDHDIFKGDHEVFKVDHEVFKGQL